ncbi:cAMP-dependent protein kinase inhibitor beta [Carettochelys insculpta]|uniref:cAMP-dependent protein kinase inhibitor beta n=1 Tax=Carettochelys insculpta TaxID=44489 RepID=UPI003EBAA67D
MTDVEPVVTDFAASGRAGRRNALPDILGSPSGAGAGTSDLQDKLAELSVSKDEESEGGKISSSEAMLENPETEGKSSDT